MKLEEVIDALEFINDGIDCNAYFNPKTKEIVYIDDYTDMTEDEKEEVYETCIGLPTKYEIDEYAMMADFIETIEDVRLYNQLQIAINGAGAFRRFKDTCINFGIEKDWYKYRDKMYKNLAIEWCEENNIIFE